MREGEAPGMQTLALQARQRPPAVERIADQAVSQMPKMYPYLVRPSGVKATVHQARAPLAEQQLDIRAGWLAGLAREIDHRHACALTRIATNSLLDALLDRPLPALVHQRQVFALHLSARDCTNQRVHDCTRLGHHHQAAGVLVQPVHDPCTRQSPRPRMVGQ